MELAYSYVKKYASAKYHSCADEPLKSQVNALLSQCQQHNDELQSRPLTKKGEGTSVLTINEKLTLCQILGEFNTLESPVCLSNKFEAIVQKYTLTDKDACSLLKAWVPAPLAAQVSAYENDNLDAEGRMKELQRALKSRDDRGINTLQRMRFRRGDDPILFCNQYLSLYKSVYNCPGMSADDPSFIYSMANICYVNYPNRIALRNANSYQSFINILRDWCEESSDGYRSDADISVVSRGTRRKKFIRCYKCHRPGHIQRFCRTPDISSLIQDDKRATEGSLVKLAKH
ncbi:posterior protein-like [Bufo gargarizans]|uniref:posterior protein-like n=1 Tax=Bufo gargarizans TaxID=30331 RepID=UPI001CF316AC|nr:posterior protein-like [Bufo gargarizans]